MLILRALCPLLLVGATAAADAAPTTEQDVKARFAAKDWAGAEAGCRALQAQHADDAEIAYALACALALQGKNDDALAALEHARALGYGDASLAQIDPSLASLRERPGFDRILAAMRELPVGSGARYEKGADIPGVRALEDQPEGGLRYRLRLGERATAAAPHRLVVWLHPSGGSADELVEPLSADLAAHGYALAVFPQKHYFGWSDAESAALAPTIAGLARVPGVDASHPIIMAFSAGGQVALNLWKAQPAAWGGLLIDAAYPAEAIPGTTQSKLVDLTPEMRAAKTPILALIGDQDPNHQVWDATLPLWTKAGLPVELRTVAGRGHEFLFAGEDWAAALAWLERLRGGGKPAPPTSR